MALRILKIPCGLGGLNSSASLDTGIYGSDFEGKVPITDLRVATNLSYESDSWQKEGGASKINTTAITGTPYVVGLYEFNTNKVAATSDGKIVTVVVGGIGSTLKTGLGTDKLTVFIDTLGASTTRKLFSFNGYDAPQVWDGVAGSTSNLATPPADWTGTNQPLGGVIHKGRLWAWLGSLIYYSTTTNHEDFTGTGSGQLSIARGYGERIAAAISFAERLFIFKYPRGIFWIDDTSLDQSNWSIRTLNNEIGVSGPLCLAMTDSEVIFLSTQGKVHALTRVQEFGGIDSGAILPDKINKFIRENVVFSKMDRAISMYYPYKSEWHCAITGTTATRNNRKIILDLKDSNNPKYRWSDRDNTESMALFTGSSGAQKMMFGDNAGFVWEGDKSSKSKDGVGYNCQFETPEIPLFKGAKRGNLQYLDIAFEPKGTHDITVLIYGDGVLSQTLSFSMGGESGGTLGSFILGTDVLGGANVSNQRRKLYGDFRRIKIVGYNNSANEDFSILEMIVAYTDGSERES